VESSTLLAARWASFSGHRLESFVNNFQKLQRTEPAIRSSSSSDRKETHRLRLLTFDLPDVAGITSRRLPWSDVHAQLIFISNLDIASPTPFTIIQFGAAIAWRPYCGLTGEEERCSSPLQLLPSEGKLTPSAEKESQTILIT